MAIVKTEEGKAEDEGGAREEAAMEEVMNLEAEDLDVEGVEVKEDGLTLDIASDLAESVEDTCVLDERVDEETVVKMETGKETVVKMETGDEPMEKKTKPLSEAELARAEAELTRSLFTGQRFAGVSLPLRAETRSLLAPVYQLAAAG